MRIRLFSKLPAALVLLAVSLGAAQAGAQTAANSRPPPAYRSTLENYQPFTEEKIVNWKEANDSAARIGGWREYAKEASQAQTPEGAAKPAPSAAPAQPTQKKP